MHVNQLGPDPFSPYQKRNTFNDQVKPKRVHKIDKENRAPSAKKANNLGPKKIPYDKQVQSKKDRNIKRNKDSNAPSVDKVKAQNPKRKTDELGKFVEAKGLHKKSRTISPYEDNKAASVSEIKDLPEGIKEHAHLRIQIFYAVALKVEGIAKRTNGDVTDVTVWVGRATKQDGQGTRKEHAAHANSAAGLSDNLYSHYIEQIVNDGITPIKARVLSNIKNMSAEELKALQENHQDKSFVQMAIHRIWDGSSAISGTEFEDQINATDKLPSSLNLGCDLCLEKAIRPYFAELIMQVMKGELDPINATDLYTAAVQKHLEGRIIEITEKITELKSASSVDADVIKRLEQQLFYHQNELAGTKTLDYEKFI